MKVTATGVTEAVGREMFVLWWMGLEESQVDADKIDVRFILEDENART